LQAEYRFRAEPAWLISFSAARYLGQHALLWLLPGGRFGVLLRDQPAQHLIASAAAWAGLIAALVLLWKHRRRDPVLSFGLVWFAIALAPVVNFVPLGNTPVAMHYAYLPGIGLALALVRAASALGSRLALPRRPALALIFALTVALGLYWLREGERVVRAWSDEEPLFATTVANYPDQVEPLVNLASVYLDRQHYDRAGALLERARAIAPDDDGVVRNQFALFWQTGQFAAALAVLDRLPEAAQRPEFQLGRGQALARLGRHGEAALALQRAFDSGGPAIDPELRFVAGYQLMVALLQSGRRAEAERVFARLLAEYPQRRELEVALQLLRAQP
jgi:tetratricopeptide (TPR) repeat protein